MKRDEKTRKWLDLPGRLNSIVSHVANGGSLTDYCRHVELDYAEVILWVNRDPGAKEAYTHALDERNNFMVQRLIEQLLKISTANVLMAYNEDGTLKELKDIPEDVSALITGIVTEELFIGQGEERKVIGVKHTVKFKDNLKGIELLGKNLRMFVDRTEHSADQSLEAMIAASMKDT